LNLLGLRLILLGGFGFQKWGVRIPFLRKNKGLPVMVSFFVDENPT